MSYTRFIAFFASFILHTASIPAQLCQKAFFKVRDIYLLLVNEMICIFALF